MPRQYRAFFIACCFLLPLEALALPRPLATFSFGADSVNTHLNQSIVILAPYSNNYISGGANLQFFGGLFLGAESSLPRDLLAQLGLGFYKSKAYVVRGSVYQFNDPNFNNLAYQYYLQSQRFIVETKLLSTIRQYFHPYLTIGAGEAINQAYQYSETGVDSDDVPMAQGFNNHTYHSFTYQVGLGLEADLTQHLRLGGGYRYVDLGKAGLGTTPLQDSSTTIQYQHLHVNEFLLQLSYLG